jgi:PhnB protein
MVIIASHCGGVRVVRRFRPNLSTGVFLSLTAHVAGAGADGYEGEQGTDQGSTTMISPMLTVRNGTDALEFYKKSFGAIELSRLVRPDGGVVAEREIDGARFGVVDESREAHNLSPATLSGTTVRINLVVSDPDAVAARAIAAGARSLFAVADQPYGWRQGRVIDPFGHHWLIGKPLETAPRQ